MMPRTYPAARECGFTLLELLMAMTILAILVATVAGAFNIGINAWEKTDVYMEATQKRRVVLDLFHRQLMTLKRGDRGSYRNDPMAVTGDAGTLAFTCRYSLLSPEGNQTVRVRYEIQEDPQTNLKRLVYFESVISDFETDGEGDDTVKESPGLEGVTLYEGFHRLSFNYLAEASDLYTEHEDDTAHEDGATLSMAAHYIWKPQWLREEERHYPRAVRLTLQEDASAAPIRVVADLQRN